MYREEELSLHTVPLFIYRLLYRGKKSQNLKSRKNAVSKTNIQGNTFLKVTYFDLKCVEFLQKVFFTKSKYKLKLSYSLHKNFSNSKMLSS